jgi:hypothetical protein
MTLLCLPSLGDGGVGEGPVEVAGEMPLVALLN